MVGGGGDVGGAGGVGVVGAVGGVADGGLRGVVLGGGGVGGGGGAGGRVASIVYSLACQLNGMKWLASRE